MMENDEKQLSFFQMVGSVLASFFGVQSSKNRSRDFKVSVHSETLLIFRSSTRPSNTLTSAMLLSNT
jgi:hypothetical protein